MAERLCQSAHKFGFGVMMRSSLECIPCFVRQALEAGQQVCDDELLLEKVMKRILCEISGFDLSLSPPEMGQKIHRILREEMNVLDPYRQVKENASMVALSMVDNIRQLIDEQTMPFDAAVRFSIAGNILDFGLISAWDDSKIMDSFQNALEKPVDSKMIQQLKNAVHKAENVLFLADNVGETVFDKLLIEQLPDHLDVTYGVKASPVINDATEVDAVVAGIDKIARVINNGTDAPGTPLEQCSGRFKQCFRSADLIIAKGQANFETLNEVGREIYFLTQIKCPQIARYYEYEVGEWVVTTTSELRNIQVVESGSER
ncbi:damage-control phosphatase ARMT1 family protein [Vibrio salinus]|uniref:damage-control phosphatase ARMT1 family protein n=1 Tax=Vibrio salinus TaxID=2899784 RepID=UPI001E4C3F19|nr:ARMT1-like domain-containing protein [Vibrio salinus]MCE0495490.1 ARMT1-like domain-containing protein [Vibrio salinus]